MAHRTDNELCEMVKNLPQHRKRALEILLKRHHKLIYKLALKYWMPGIDYDDLYQEAVLGFRYSCMSFDPKKASFNTHVGYGIMKYCRAMHTTSQYRRPEGEKYRKGPKRVPESISQRVSAERVYYTAQQATQHKPTRLTPTGYNRLLKRLGMAKLTEEDRLVLALAYSVGPKELRQQYKAHLWGMWIEEKINELTRRAKATERRRLYHRSLKEAKENNLFS